MDHTGTQPDIPIVHEDRHLLVINKPHNILSQKDQTGDPDVVSLCKEYLQKKHDSEGEYLGLVHRLDRPVGGLMLLAKTSMAARALSKQIRNRVILKTYWAVVWGYTPGNGLLTHYLLKDRKNNVVKTVSAQHGKAKKAILSFERLQQSKKKSLISIHLQTGRPHQIRVQMATEGYPIWGDYKYGKRDKPSGRIIALRAVELVFEHPGDKQQKRFLLPPPPQPPWNKFDYQLI